MNSYNRLAEPEIHRFHLTFRKLVPMLPEDRAETVKRYRARYDQYGYDPRTLGWFKGRQNIRYAVAFQGVDLGFERILDVGCGFGDLFAFLLDRGWKGTYVGVDIVPELIAEAEKRHGAGGARFECVDISSEKFDFQADVAIASGVFNHILKGSNWDFIRDMFDKMWQLSSDVVIADFLSTAADKPHKHLFRVDPREAADLAGNYSNRFTLQHDYMPFEFMVKVWHDNSFPQEMPVFSTYRQYLGSLEQE